MTDWELLHDNAANCESRRLIERLAGWDFETDGADWERDAVDQLDWGWPDDAVDQLDWGWLDAVDRLDWGLHDDAVDWLDWEIPEISE